MSRVTISFPVYNGSAYIEQSLLSALNQTFDDIEYLIIDDHGTENAMDVVRRVVSEHPRKDSVRFIDNGANLGISMVRNNSIAQATSDYLLFMDADDLLSEDCIATMYGEMERHKVDFVAGSLRKVFEDGTVEDILLPDITINDNRELLMFHSSQPIYMMTWNKLYDVEFLRKNSICCVPGQKGEDDAFWFQVIWHASSCRLLSTVTYDWIWNSASVTGGFRRSGMTYAIASMYEDIVRFKRTYISENEHPFRGAIFERIVVADTLWHIFKVIGSDKLGKEERHQLINSMSDFSQLPVDIHKEIGWKTKILLWIFGLPYGLKNPLLRCIRRVKGVK